MHSWIEKSHKIGPNSTRQPLARVLRTYAVPYVTNDCQHAFLYGDAEIARPDIARPDNAAPYRETCFSVRVDAHHKFMFDSGSII